MTNGCQENTNFTSVFQRNQNTRKAKLKSVSKPLNKRMRLGPFKTNYRVLLPSLQAWSRTHIYCPTQGMELLHFKWLMILIKIRRGIIYYKLGLAYCYKLGDFLKEMTAYWSMTTYPIQKYLLMKISLYEEQVYFYR